MSAAHGIEAALAGALLDALARRGWPRSQRWGEAIGALALRLGLRARVARDNLALAFPDRDAGAREAILAAHYRELGRVVAEYAEMPRLVRAPEGEVIASLPGREHLDAAIAGGRGAILLSGHYSNFELLGAWLTRFHPLTYVVRPLGNPAVEARIDRLRRAAGIEPITGDASLRRVYEALRANRWIAMVADQDARRHGVFVPFFGRLASTAIGPARIALRTGAPIVMGFVTRRADGRLDLALDPPLAVERPDAPDAAERLTALHAARLEAKVRERPELWFWLHRRWKTPPPVSG